MKALAQFQKESFLLRRVGRQLRITAPEVVHFSKWPNGAFGFPAGGIMVGR
jgi:hypothetical protein